MQASMSLRAFKELFAFPFRGENWQNKFLIGSALIFASSVVPILPLLPVLGYIAEIARRSIRSQGEEVLLPDWTNWGTLFLDGLRLLGAGFIITLPATLVFLVGFGTYIATVIPASMMNELNRGRPAGPEVLLPLVGILIYFFSIFLYLGLTVISALFLPAAGAHVAFTGHFRALFQKRWLQVLRANWSGFFVVLFILAGLGASAYFAYMAVFFTIILCMFSQLAAAPVGFYSLQIMALVSGEAYREGAERLDAAQNAPSTVTPDTDAPLPA